MVQSHTGGKNTVSNSSISSYDVAQIYSKKILKRNLQMDPALWGERGLIWMLMAVHILPFFT